jgi:hypothetical protein
MDKKQSVILCGKSLFMTGMALNLQKDGGFHIIETTSPAEMGEILKIMRPTAILADNGSTDRDWVAALTRDHPQVSIITLNPENSNALVYSFHKEQINTIQDLKNIIIKHSISEDAPQR